MHVAHVVQELMIVLAASLVAVWVLGRLKLPSIVGFLAAGILIGPNAFGLVTEKHLIEVMAEVGVVLLMFTIGLKFSMAELARMKGLVFGAGGLQVLGTIAVCAGGCMAFGMSLPEATFIGFLVALSSTAIVLKLFEEKGETESAHGRLATGVLIFQDLAVVPLILVTPMLGGAGGSTGEALLSLGKSMGLVVVILVLAKFLLPLFFAFVAKTRSRELFTLATMLVILATAGAASVAGLSLALGALIAGVVLSESDYAQQVLSDVVPLRDLLSSLFFVSIGMLVDVRGWIAEPVITLGLTAAIFAAKGLVVWGIARGFGLSPRVSILAGLAIGQIGEFSFVLAVDGGKHGLLPDQHYQTFLSVSVLTMAATPFLLMLGPWLTRDSHVGGAGHDHAAEGHGARKGHVIVAGYGITGRNVAAVLNQMKVPVLIVELNADTIKRVRAEGGEAIFGDAGREEVLHHAGIAGARAIVLTVLDPAGTRQAVATIRRLNPAVEIIVRTRFVAELAELRRLGAHAVVPEELEGSIAIASLTMERFGASPDAVARTESALRGDGDYQLLQQDTSMELRETVLARVLGAASFTEITVPAASAGKTLRGLDLRAKTGCLVVAQRRGNDVTPAPAPDAPLSEGDILLILARPIEADAVRKLLAG